MSQLFLRGLFFSVVLLTLGLCSASAGTFKTIAIDGDYSDWAGVPILDADGGDNAGGPDIGNTQIANDANYLYIRNTFPNNLSLGTFVTIDIDENAATGFNIFGLGLVGTEAGWQNDFPFTQAAGVFNDGQGMSGEFFGSGAANLDSFSNSGSRELAINLDIVRNNPAGPVFPDDTIRLLVWTDLGGGADGIPAGSPNDSGLNGDVSGVINYTLAVPEASTIILALAALASLTIRPRRRMM
jgi:hypothetical protein